MPLMRPAYAPQVHVVSSAGVSIRSIGAPSPTVLQVDAEKDLCATFYRMYMAFSLGLLLSTAFVPWIIAVTPSWVCLPDSSSTPARVFLLISLLWDFIDKAPFNGKGRPIWAFRRSGVWRLVAGYFPASFITETKLDAGRSYIFALHPHGICGFLAQHPWLDVSCVTVRANFLIPLWRDLVVLGFGLVDASKDSCRAVLSHGRSLAIVVGGAAESLDAHPGTLDLTLRKRRGFVAMALETGADLVPVLTFGETNLFAQAPNPRGSRLRRFQEGTIRRFGFAAPLFYGRGIIQPWFGLVAHREPLVTVFGAPLRVEKAIATPTAEQIDALHERYVAALMLLFERHRHALAPDCAKGLRIVA